MRHKKALRFWVIIGAIFLLFVAFRMIVDYWDPYSHRWRFGYDWQKQVTSPNLVQPTQWYMDSAKVQVTPAPGPVTPPGIPGWLVIVLAIGLPFAYQFILIKFSGIAKTLVTYAVSGAVTILLTILAKKPPGWDQIAWVWALQNFVYQLLVKPVFAKIEVAKKKE